MFTIIYLRIIDFEKCTMKITPFFNVLCAKAEKRQHTVLVYKLWTLIVYDFHQHSSNQLTLKGSTARYIYFS
eukprot:UN20589